LNSIDGAESRDKILILFLWPEPKFELRFLSKETMKKERNCSKRPNYEELVNIKN
jgi:hypothetical protein